jgi:hypothetical protein
LPHCRFIFNNCRIDLSKCKRYSRLHDTRKNQRV